MIKNFKKPCAIGLIAVLGIMIAGESAEAQWGRRRPRATPVPRPTPYQRPAYQPGYYTQPAYQPTPYPTPYPSSSYGSYGSSSYGTYTPPPQRVNYGTLNQYANWIRFATPAYGYRATPAFGPAYDKSATTAAAVPEIQTIITATLASGTEVDIGAATVNTALVKKIYRLRGDNPAFVTTFGPNQVGYAVKGLFETGVLKMGLSPADYWSSEMETRFRSNDPRVLAELDLLLMQSFIQLASDLNTGRSVSKMVDTHTLFKAREFTEFAALNNALRQGSDMLGQLEALAPQHLEYQQLQIALNGLRQVKARGGWKPLSGAATLKPGKSYPDVAILRTRLYELGLLDYTAGTSQSQVYDSQVVEAAKIFQTNHKLDNDGILGPASFRILNIPIDERIDQIRANMDKWRVMPRQLGDRYIMVNIARQELEVMEHGVVVMSMNTVNGKTLRPTPVVVDSMDSLALNPYWNPPDNNIRADILPAQRKDRNHLRDHRIKIFRSGEEVDPATVDWSKYVNSWPFQFREEPGPTNSLGVVKFNLNLNGQAIYLHDTNHRELFVENDRLRSSGCIRVQRPFDLLQYLLRDKAEYSYYRLDEILSQPTVYPKQEVKLTKAIPVYLMYQTVSFSDDGKLRFTTDVYGQDSRIVRAMTPGSVY